MTTTTNHRSTTTPERFYHIKEPHADAKGKTYKAGTVFMRQEPGCGWLATVARCSVNDNFCKQTGRVVARRRFFKEGRPMHEVRTPSYEEALRIYKSI